ncbi:hypothetical protein HK096_009086, partial [Nowakowskiella sp. JEL0078]
NLSVINELAIEANANVVVHCGNFGFFDHGIRGTMTENDKSSELLEFVDQKKTFVVPFDVINKFNSGEYIVPNLHIINERKSFIIPLKNSNTSIFTSLKIIGLPGIIPSIDLMSQSMSSQYQSLEVLTKKSKVQTWSSLLKIGQLVESESFEENQIRIMVISQENNYLPEVVAQISSKLQTSHVIMSSSSQPNWYNPYNLWQNDGFLVRRDEVASAIGRWCLQTQSEFDAIFSIKQAGLLAAAMSVWSPSNNFDLDKHCQFFTLPDSVGNLRMTIKKNSFNFRISHEAQVKESLFEAASKPLSLLKSIPNNTSPKESQITGWHKQYHQTASEESQSFISSSTHNASIVAKLPVPTPAEWAAAAAAVGIRLPNVESVNLWDSSSQTGWQHQHTTVKKDGISELVALTPNHWESKSVVTDSPKELIQNHNIEGMTIWVGNLPENITEDDVRVFFRGISILRIKMSAKRADKRPCAYIDLPDSDCLEKALRLSGEAPRITPED